MPNTPVISKTTLVVMGAVTIIFLAWIMTINYPALKNAKFYTDFFTSAAVRLAGRDAIKYSDFFKKTDVRGIACLAPSSDLVARCKRAGGELKDVIIGIDTAVRTQYGCYPQGSASDEGKDCKRDAQCEGFCVWDSHSDFVGEWNAVAQQCGADKKPFFSFPKDPSKGYYFCE